MFVNSSMIPKHKALYLKSSQLVGDALKKLEELDLDGLPVVSGKKYDGIITRHDIYKAFFYQSAMTKEEFLSKTNVSEIATRKDVYIDEDEVFENTLLLVKNFPAVAVVDEDKNFLGVVTRFDILEQFRSSFGMNRKGVRIAFTTVDSEGQLARLSEISNQFHENIISVTTFDETDKLARRVVIKVEATELTQKFIKKLEDSGFRITGIKEC